MYTIASNITTRNRTVNTIFRKAKAGKWFESAEANADLQNLAERYT